MVQYDPRLPTSLELPDSDDTPVDNELQDTVPGLLKLILTALWQDRDDWFFGVDMGIYADTRQPYRAIVPDGFLSLNVPRFKSNRGRPSYVLWEENWTMPILSLEVVSDTYRGEYEQKLEDYRSMGILFYAIYNPDGRRKRDSLEVYKLVDGNYVRQPGEPVWMDEIGLGIGRAGGEYMRWQREWLFWFDQSGERHRTSEERQRGLAEQAVQLARQAVERAEQVAQRAEQAVQRAEQAEQATERLKDYLRSQGIDPDTL